MEQDIISQLGPWFDLLVVGISIVLGIVLGFVFWLFVFQMPKNEKATAEDARQIAQARWYVKKVLEGEKGAVGLKLASEGRRRSELIFICRPHHPDVEEFRSLRNMDKLAFEFVPEPLECALPIELCAYLRFKSKVVWSC